MTAFGDAQVPALDPPILADSYSFNWVYYNYGASTVAATTFVGPGAGNAGYFDVEIVLEIPPSRFVYTGAAWRPTTDAKIFDGTAWRPYATAQIYTGTQWKPLTN